MPKQGPAQLSPGASPETVSGRRDLLLTVRPPSAFLLLLFFQVFLVPLGDQFFSRNLRNPHLGCKLGRTLVRQKAMGCLKHKEKKAFLVFLHFKSLQVFQLCGCLGFCIFRKKKSSKGMDCLNSIRVSHVGAGRGAQSTWAIFHSSPRSIRRELD